jgi:hypothetical protein
VLVDFKHRQVGHEPLWRCAVPVVLTGLKEHAVARPDDLDGAAAALAATNSIEDVDRLSGGVGVPGGAGARCEVDAGGLQTRRRGGLVMVST